MTYPSQAQMVLPCYCNLFDFFQPELPSHWRIYRNANDHEYCQISEDGHLFVRRHKVVNLDYFIFFGILRSKRGLTTLKSTTQRQTTNPPKAIYANSNQKSLSPRYTGSYISDYSLQFYYKNSRLIIYSSKKKTWHPVDPSLTKI